MFIVHKTPVKFQLSTTKCKMCKCLLKLDSYFPLKFGLHLTGQLVISQKSTQF